MDTREDDILQRMSAVWQAWLKSPLHDDMDFDDWYLLHYGSDTLAAFFSDADDCVTEPQEQPHADT